MYRRHVDDREKEKIRLRDLQSRDDLTVTGGEKNRMRGWTTFPAYQKPQPANIDFLAPKPLSSSETIMCFDLNGPTMRDDARRLGEITFWCSRQETRWERDKKTISSSHRTVIFSEDFELIKFPSFGSLPENGRYYSRDERKCVDGIHFLGNLDVSGVQKSFMIPNDVYIEGSLIAKDSHGFEIQEDIVDIWSLEPTFRYHFEVGAAVDVVGLRGSCDSYFFRSWLPRHNAKTVPRGMFPADPPSYTP